MGFNTGIIDGWTRPVIVVSSSAPVSSLPAQGSKFEICRFVWLLPRCGLKSNRRRSKATAKATAKLAMRVFGIGRACYLLTGITTFSGIIDYAHICTHTHTHTHTYTHSHWKTAERKGATFRMEDTVTHNICNCLLLTCGSRRPFGPQPCPPSPRPITLPHTYAYLMRADLPCPS